MSRKKCCCKQKHDECCCQPASSGFLGGGCTPIIFLLIACGSGLLNCNKSYLIILLFLLCGGSFSKFLGSGGESNCC
jgi:hypothetical protein